MAAAKRRAGRDEFLHQTVATDDPCIICDATIYQIPPAMYVAPTAIIITTARRFRPKTGATYSTDPTDGIHYHIQQQFSPHDRLRTAAG